MEYSRPSDSTRRNRFSAPKVASLPQLSRSPETSCADGRLSDRGRPSSILAPRRRSKVPSKEATAAHHTRRNLRREDSAATQSLKRGVGRTKRRCVCGRSGSASTFNSGRADIRPSWRTFFFPYNSRTRSSSCSCGSPEGSSGLEVDREVMTTAAASATPALVTGR